MCTAKPTNTFVPLPALNKPPQVGLPPSLNWILPTHQLSGFGGHLNPPGKAGWVTSYGSSTVSLQEISKQ